MRKIDKKIKRIRLKTDRTGLRKNKQLLPAADRQIWKVVLKDEKLDDRFVRRMETAHQTHVEQEQ